MFHDGTFIVSKIQRLEDPFGSEIHGRFYLKAA